MEKYNGHANYETWNVCLWIDNEEFIYRDKVRLIRRKGDRLTAADVEAFAREYFPDGTPDMDGPADMNKVDWDEIADGWKEEE